MMKEKLDILIKSTGHTATSFARLLDVQPSGISHILSGRNKPSFDFVVKILRAFPTINPDWLLLGSVQMYRDGVTSPIASSDNDALEDASLFEAAKNIEMSEGGNLSENEFPSDFHQVQISSTPSRRIERVIVLYADRSFESYSAK